MCLLPMANIKQLRASLKEKGFSTTAFPFNYNNNKYVVLFEVLDTSQKSNKLFIARFTFLKNNDFNNKYTVEANSLRLGINSYDSYKSFCEFFEINPNNKYKEFLPKFCAFFGRAIPTTERDDIPEVVHENIIRHLASHDSRNPKAIYCYKLMRHHKIDGKQKKRSVYNNQLAAKRKPKLYELFKDDMSVSFCFSDTPQKEKSDMEILRNFMKNNPTHF